LKLKAIPVSALLQSRDETFMVSAGKLGGAKVVLRMKVGDNRFLGLFRIVQAQRGLQVSANWLELMFRPFQRKGRGEVITLCPRLLIDDEPLVDPQ